MKKLIVLKEYSIAIDQMAEDVKSMEELNDKFYSDISYIQKQIQSGKLELDLSANKVPTDLISGQISESPNKSVKTGGRTPDEPTSNAQVTSSAVILQ